MAIPTSVMLQVERAIFSAIAGGPVASPDRGNTGEYSADCMPAYNLALMEFANGYGKRDTTHDSLRVTGTWALFCYAAASSGITATDALDPLLTWAHQQLADSTLSGLAVGVELTGGKLNWNEKDGVNTVEAALMIEVEFDISRGDPSQNFNG